MSYDHEVILYGLTYTADDIGNQIPAETETLILCGELSVTHTEFYNAAAKGLRPSKILRVHRFEYNDETLVKYEDGIKYRVIRTYAVNNEEIELRQK